MFLFFLIIFCRLIQFDKIRSVFAIFHMLNSLLTLCSEEIVLRSVPPPPCFTLIWTLPLGGLYSLGVALLRVNTHLLIFREEALELLGHFSPLMPRVSCN
jgi:hypothetical protein